MTVRGRAAARAREDAAPPADAPARMGTAPDPASDPAPEAASVPEADPAPPSDEDEQLALLHAALARVRAPDVVVAVSRAGRRTVVSGGTATPPPPVPRAQLRFALGSLSKTFTVLLLADLARAGVLGLDDPVAAHLPGLPLPSGDLRRITLRHLATHTAGLPRVPRDLLAAAVLHPYTNGYAGYSRERLLTSFAGARIRHAPGTRWHYSNLGLALLGPVMESATGAAFPDLLARRVLRPLGLTATGPGPAMGPDVAIGRRGDGRTPMPATDMAAFAAAGALLSTPDDVLAYGEALLRPEAHGSPAGAHDSPADAHGSLAEALRDVQIPQLRKGFGRRRETHTLTWFQHEAPGGPLFFHAGATFGQQCLLGFHPATRTAVAAFSTRHDRRTAVVPAAYSLLHDLIRHPSA